MTVSMYFRCLLILLSIWTLSGCLSQQRLIRDSYTLKRGEGIVAFRLHYLEGLPTFKLLTFNVEDLDRIFLKRFRVKRNSSSLVLFSLRSGQYFFSTIQAQVEEKNPQKKTLNNVFDGRMLENTFSVEPGRINYIGDILLQVQREHSGKPLVLVGSKKGSSSIVSYSMYLLHHFSDGTVKKIREIYPELSEKYSLFQENLAWGTDSLAIKESYLGNELGYGEENYGMDHGGYGEYKWGMSKKEVRELLEKQGDKYEVEGNRFVAMRSNGSIREYYFSSLSLPFWKDRLYKVVLHLKVPLANVLKRVELKYGTGKKKEESWIWEIPSTLVILEEKKESLLSYVSKEHERIEFLNGPVSSK